jgi:low affinity Fe/Cu permease
MPDTWMVDHRCATRKHGPLFSFRAGVCSRLTGVPILVMAGSAQPESGAGEQQADRMRTARGRAGETLQHPADRGRRHIRTAFDRFAEGASFLASSPLFFALCLAVIITWAGGLILGASDRFEAGAAGLMSAMTLILVALLKNAELRAERAVQHKLDAIATALLAQDRGHVGDADRKLEQAIGVHEQI